MKDHSTSIQHRYLLIIRAALVIVAFVWVGENTKAGTLYWGGTSAQSWTATSGTRWGTSDSPYATTWVSGSDAVFNVANSTITGATTQFASITANENVTVSPSGTIGTNGTVASITVALNKTFDFGTQSISTVAGTGFIKNGAGVFALNAGGNIYSGGFTLNAGTIIARGAFAMGSGGALTINSGTIAANATRDFTGKYTGITVGGDFQLGALSTAVALSSSTANLTFSNTMALGAAT